MNPHWDFRFYTDVDCEDFVRNHCSQWASLYFFYPPGIYRADIFRLLVLLHGGGVYADIDVECRRPLDDLIAHHGQGDSWEVLLSTDHPVHEHIHFRGRRIYMNDFMIARPGASFLRVVLEEIRERTEKRGKQNDLKPANAVFETGPGIFTQVIEEGGDPGFYKVRILPWQIIHPIPDMSCCFAERPEWERAILDGSWKAPYDPYVVHYWYHTWCKGGTTLEHYSKHLLQTPGEIVDARLQKLVPYLGKRADAIEAALVEFAQLRPAGTIVECGLINPYGEYSMCRVAGEVLQGMGHRYLGIDSHEEKLSEARRTYARYWQSDRVAWQSVESTVALEALERQSIGLLFLNGTECSKPLAQIIIDRDRLIPGGLVLIDGDASECQAVRTVFEGAGYESIHEGPPYLVRRPLEMEWAIPRVIHWFSGPFEHQLVVTTGLQKSGWAIQEWDAEAIAQWLDDEGKAYQEIIICIDNEAQRRKIVQLGVIASHGGVVMSDRSVIDLERMEELLSDKRLILVARSSENSKVCLSQSRDALSLEFIAGEPNHPFWKGLQAALVSAVQKVYQVDQLDEQSRLRKALISFRTEVFLTRRLRICPWFLDEKDYPEVVELTSQNPSNESHHTHDVGAQASATPA